MLWLWLTGGYVVGVLGTLAWCFATPSFRELDYVERDVTVLFIFLLPGVSWLLCWVCCWHDGRLSRAEARIDAVAAARNARAEEARRDAAFWLDRAESGTPLERAVASQVLEHLRDVAPDEVELVVQWPRVASSEHVDGHVSCRCVDCLMTVRDRARSSYNARKQFKPSGPLYDEMTEVR